MTQQSTNFLDPSVRVVGSKAGGEDSDDGDEGSSTSSFRAKFPGLYSFGGSRSASSGGDDDDGGGGGVVTDVTNKIKRAADNTADKVITGTAALNALITTAIKDPKEIGKLMGTFINKKFQDVTSMSPEQLMFTLGNRELFISSLKKLAAVSPIAGIVALANSGFSFFNSKVQPGAVASLRKAYSGDQYVDTVKSVVLTTPQATLVKLIAGAADGTKYGYQFPFSTNDALSPNGLKKWQSTYDKELFIYSTAIVKAFARVPDKHKIFEAASTHWLAYALAFANVESNMDQSAKNLSGGGFNVVEGSVLKRHGAFGAFQLRWRTNVVSMWKAYPTLFAQYKPTDFDSDLELQALLFGILLNGNIKAAAKTWFTVAPDGKIQWASASAESQLGELNSLGNMFGVTPLGILTALCNIGMAVGPMTPATDTDNKKSFPVKMAQAEKFKENLRAKASNLAVYELALSSGMSLGCLAKVCQTK